MLVFLYEDEFHALLRGRDRIWDFKRGNELFLGCVTPQVLWLQVRVEHVGTNAI